MVYYIPYMIFLLILFCFFVNILAGIVSIVCGFKSKGLTGVFYTLATLGLSYFWSITGTLFLEKLPITNNWLLLTIFFIWNSAVFLPWILFYRKKNDNSETPYRKIGLAGFFTQIFFLTGITALALDGSLQKNLDYISRYCGCLLLLSIVPCLVLIWFAVVCTDTRWKYRKISLALVIVISALFFFFAGAGALRVSA